MRILDIDLDFFQSDIHCFDTDKDTFLKDEGIKIWDKDKFLDFIETACGLSKEHKLPGRVMKHHVEAYLFWRELIESGKIEVPFEVTHIDAHSDLAFTPNTLYYSFLQSLDKERKEMFEQGIVFEQDNPYLDSGNYLLDAVISGWIDRITYIPHPKLEYLDVAGYIVKNIVPQKKFGFNFCKGIEEKNVILEMKDIYNYNMSQEEYDFVTVSLSPPYVKKEMEEYIEILKVYLNLI